nr:DUF2946 family protein [Xanthomonas nasturtii]WVL53427.1 DUF2946 family protein [Xanthomonas nasturtii]
MHAPVFYRCFNTWAWLAMLLIVVAPLVSRTIAHPTPDSMHALDAHAAHQPKAQSSTLQLASAHHMHHDMGQGRDHAMAVTPDPSDRGATTPLKPSAPHAEHEMGVDCEYCLMAARMIGLLVALLLLLTTWPAVLRALLGLVDTRRVPALGTLGARGPPTALIC